MTIVMYIQCLGLNLLVFQTNRFNTVQFIISPDIIYTLILKYTISPDPCLNVLSNQLSVTDSSSMHIYQCRWSSHGQDHSMFPDGHACM